MLEKRDGRDDGVEESEVCMEQKEPLLEVKGLKKYYPIKDGIITHTIGHITAVDGVDFKLYPGETLGLVGESGCGKSTIGRQIVALENPSEGEILYKGRPIRRMAKDETKEMKRNIQMIFQDPYSSLNPRKTVFEILSYPMLYHKICSEREAPKEVERLLDLVGLSKNMAGRYPHEFSGGQRQRIGIARALSLRPELIICDEPVSALDVSIQAQILNLLKNLQKEFGFTYLFIGHGLDAVHYISDRIAVMYLGKFMETGQAQELFENPGHPYTVALCNASPIPDPKVRDRNRRILTDEIPSNVDIPAGCRFHPRCFCSTEHCKFHEPSLLSVNESGTHMAACPIMNPLQRQEETEACISI